MTASCEGCRYHVPVDRAVGTCRRFPPAIVSDRDPDGRWPYTSMDDWCGEFRPDGQKAVDPGSFPNPPPPSI